MGINENTRKQILYKWGSYKNSNYMLEQLSVYRYFNSDNLIGYAQSAGKIIHLKNPQRLHVRHRVD